jgi:two-component system aerobic respiration control sensor histidine kinase ArcB
VTIYRIILNLLGNALKFTQQGSIGIQVELGQKSTSEKAIVKIIICDTGIGIPTDKQEAIFQRFVRLVPSYQGTYKGSGIGLYLVQKFVKAMGGEIHVKSEEGKGSQFAVIIPLKVPLLTDDERKDAFELPSFINNQHNLIKAFAAKEADAEISATDGVKARILLVEDSLMAQKSTRLLLASLGCVVDVAECGEKALALFEPGKYQLVLMDIGLPDMKGYQVAKCLKDREATSSFPVPILGLSAHATQEEKNLSAMAGMVDVLHKPLLLKQAKTILEKYVLMEEKEQKNISVVEMQKIWGEQKISGKQEQRIHDVLDEWLTALPECRAELERAYETHNMDLLGNRLHKLHGDLCYINLPSLLEAVKTLEQQLKNGEYAEVEKRYGYILDEMKKLEKNILS